MQLKGVGKAKALKLYRLLEGSMLDKTEAFDFLSSASARSIIGSLSFSEWDKARSRADELMESCDTHEVKLISLSSRLYPPRLRQIPDPPAILYYKGSLTGLLDEPPLAVIGTRKPTDYGCRWGHRATQILVEFGFSIVSGLALGCDAIAHRAALEAGGRTIAVMAGGLDKVSPAQHRELAGQIIDNGGALVSEYPPKLAPQKSHFVDRDRIQSGLSLGVLVIETGIEGGTMHTVRFAIKQGRKIAALLPPESKRAADKVQGNIKLINEQVATPVFQLLELENFISFLTLPDSEERTLNRQASRSFESASSEQLDFLGDV